MDNLIEEKRDCWVSFQETDHKHPYDNPFLLKLEDIFGWMVAYRKPFNEYNRKSMKNYRNRLTRWCRDNCNRFPDNCENVKKTDTCRMYYLKQAYTREIRGLKARIVKGKATIEIM